MPLSADRINSVLKNMPNNDFDSLPNKDKQESTSLLSMEERILKMRPSAEKIYTAIHPGKNNTPDNVYSKEMDYVNLVNEMEDLILNQRSSMESLYDQDKTDDIFKDMARRYGVDEALPAAIGEVIEKYSRQTH